MDSSGRQYAAQVAYAGWSTASHQSPQQPGYQQQAPMYYGQLQSPPGHTAFPQPAQQALPPPGGPYTFPPPTVTGQPQLQPPLLQIPPSTPEPSTESRASACYETSVYVGLDDAPVEFRLAFRVIGEKGQNLEYLSRTTNAKVILRGRGTGIVNNKPLHIFVGHATLEGKEEAESLANNLVRAVKEEFSDWLKEKGFPKKTPPVPAVTSSVKETKQNGTTRPREMQGLRITRDPGGRVEVRHEDSTARPPPRNDDIHRGESRPTPRHEDLHGGESHRVVKIPRAELSALNRLGPRVPIGRDSGG